MTTPKEITVCFTANGWDTRSDDTEISSAVRFDGEDEIRSNKHSGTSLARTNFIGSVVSFEFYDFTHTHTRVRYKRSWRPAKQIKRKTYFTVYEFCELCVRLSPLRTRMIETVRTRWHVYTRNVNSLQIIINDISWKTSRIINVKYCLI